MGKVHDDKNAFSAVENGSKCYPLGNYSLFSREQEQGQ